MSQDFLDKFVQRVHISKINYSLSQEVKPYCLGRILKYPSHMYEAMMDSTTSSHRKSNCPDCLAVAKKKLELELEELEAHITRLKDEETVD